MLWLTLRQVAIPAVAQDTPSATPAPVVALPPIAEGANLFYVSHSDLALMAAQAPGAETLSAAPQPDGTTDAPIKQTGIAAPPLIEWAAPEPTENHLYAEGEQVAAGAPLSETATISGTAEEYGTDAGHSIGELFQCPGSNQIAVQMYFGPKPVVFLLAHANAQTPAMRRLTDSGWGVFLNWHPNCQQALVRMHDLEIPDPGLWLVDVHDRSHVQISIPDLVAPEGLIDAAFSPDGSKLAYATTKGIGYGSRLFILDLATQEHRLVRTDETTLVAGLSWSPDGAQVAFMLLLDGPAPFTEAGLWRMKADGSEQQFLARMDGGRGQEPVWSHDSQQLFFVARENRDDATATYIAKALVSSIKAVRVTTGEATVLVDSPNARQLDLELLPDGSLLFVSNRATAAGQGPSAPTEVWLRTLAGQLHQLTADGTEKRHPVFAPVVPEQ